MLRVRHPSPQWSPWTQGRLLPTAPANIGVELGAFSDNANPSTSITGTTFAPSAISDKIVLTLFIPNSNPTGLTVTYDGVALTEVTGARATRNNKTLCVFYMDETANRLAGRTVSASWTNTGTQNGGGSLAQITAITPSNTFVVGAPDVVAATNGQTLVPTTPSSGAPSDATANYVAFAALAVQNNVANAEAPINGYTAMQPQVINATRSLVLDVAVREFRQPPVAAQTETWNVTWGGALSWCSAILMFKESVPGAPAISIAPLVTGTPAVGSTLTTDNGTWTNVPTAYSYDWQRDVGSGGATWVSIDSNQQVTLNGTVNVTVTSIANLHIGDPIYGTNIPAGATISAITNATTIIISAAATGSGSVTAYFGANNVNSYVVTANDLGCQLRCVVTASNASGSGTGAPSNASAGSVPPPAAPTYRVVVNPLAQSDNKVHTSTTALPVLAGETLVYLGACSVSNTGGDIGSVSDPAGNLWTQLTEGLGGSVHAIQAFSAVAAAGLAYGSVITTKVKQTTVVGSNALNSATINVGDTTGFDASGTIDISNIAVTYTGLTPTTLTGCGAHAAYTGGEVVAYHGQSPYWYVVAINPGLGATCAFDVAAAGASAFGATASSPAVATKGAQSVALGFHGRNAVEQWTPAAGWTKMFDGPFANAGNPFGGESLYSASGEAQILTGPQASLTANGTNASNDTLSSLVVVFSIAATVASTVRPTFPNPLLAPTPMKFKPGLGASAAALLLTPVSSAISFVLEALGVVTTTNDLPLEASAGISAGSQAPLEATGGIAASGQAPLEALQGIAQTAAEVVEANQGLAGSSGLPLEALQGIAQTVAEVVEASQGLAGSSGLPLEAPQGLSTATGGPLEASGGIAGTGSSPVEATSGLAGSGLAPIEALGTATTPVSQTASLIIESLAAISSSAPSPLESAGVVAASLALALEALQGQGSSLVLPLEAGTQIVGSLVLPLEATAGLTQSAVVVLEARGGAAAVVLLPIDAAGVTGRTALLVLFDRADAPLLEEAVRNLALLDDQAS
jgi:hypothetical protein